MNKPMGETLTDPKTLERLACLIEECGEVLQCAGKIMRHGYHTVYKEQTNRWRLEEEIGQLEFIIGFLKENGDIDPINVLNATLRKRDKIQKYFHHNKVVTYT